MTIGIVDYGMGNIGSIQNMLRYIGVSSFVSSNPIELKKAERLIVPGVGRFDAAMRNLRERDLIESLNNMVKQDKIPTLGICLGMQLFCEWSEEGNCAGLGYVDAQVCRFVSNEKRPIKIPHMGWSSLEPKRDHSTLSDIGALARFYFVHSYYVQCSNAEDVLAYATHGQQFVAAFQRENVIGVQFHPEKSHRFGMQLLRNFAAGVEEPA